MILRQIICAVAVAGGVNVTVGLGVRVAVGCGVDVAVRVEVKTAVGILDGVELANGLPLGSLVARGVGAQATSKIVNPINM